MFLFVSTPSWPFYYTIKYRSPILSRAICLSPTCFWIYCRKNLLDSAMFSPFETVICCQQILLEFSASK